MVTLEVYGYFNYEGILVYKKLMTLMVGCLSFGAVQGMEFLDPARVDLNPGDLERNVAQWIEAYVRRDLTNSESRSEAYDYKDFNELKESLLFHLIQCTPDKLDIYRPCLIYSPSGKIEHRLIVSLKLSVSLFIKATSDLPGDTSAVVSRLKEIEVIINDYQPEKVPGKQYEPERQPSNGGDGSLGSSRVWYYLTRVGLPVAIGCGIYWAFFVEGKKSVS